MLQNLQIRSKLAAIVLVPLAAVIVLSSIGIGWSVNRAVKASRAQNVSEFAVTLTALVHELQKERGLAAAYVGGGKSTGYTELAAQWANVDRQVVGFARNARGLQLSGYNPQLRQELRNVVGELAKLDAQRQAIDQSPDITVANTLNQYDTIIQDILDVNGEIAVGSGDQRLLRTTSAFVALSRMKDAVDLQRSYLNAVFSAGHFDGSQLQYQQLARYVEAEDLWNGQFSSLATSAQRNLLATTLASPSVQKAQVLREGAIRGETSQRLNVAPDEWSSVMGDKLNLLRQFEVRLSRDVVAAASDLEQSARRQALVVGIGSLAVLLVTVVISLAIGRSIVRPLRQLRQAANEVADERLPRVVERLQETPDLDRVALDQMSPVPVRSRDEVGQVASAFNTVHQVAVRVATEQAALRRSIGDMFLNLARRSQTLLDRQLELIDRLERDEADPDALENLFKLDHLATRMRRNAEDLIVLSGAEPPRRWSQPVPLVDVVRGALAEVEDYQRVELLPIDDVGVAGHAVTDVVHALAEVIENAISFSPPGTKVQVAGQPVSNGYVLEIEDRGLGMSDEELIEANERLANPPLIDFALSRMMGLYVVGRLAQRYGIRVQLRHSWYGGITALVLLPPSITIRPQFQESGLGTGIGIRRPELAPPPRSNGDRGQPGDRLPIFEQARSDWFEEPATTPPPLRRPVAQPIDTSGTSNGNGDGDPAAVVDSQRYDAEAEDFEASAPLEAELTHPAEAPEDTVELMMPPESQLVEEAEQVEPVDRGEPRGEPLAEPETQAPPPPPPPVPPAHSGVGEREPGPGLRERPRFTLPGAPLPRRQRPGQRQGPGPDWPVPPQHPGSRETGPDWPVPPQRQGPRPDWPVPPRRPAPRDAAPDAPEAPAPSRAERLWPEQVPGPEQQVAPPERSMPQAFATPDAGPESRRPSQPPLGPPMQPRSWQAPPASARSPRLGEDIAVPLPDPSLQPASIQTTRAGLPRRVPRANLAPGIVAQAQRTAEDPQSAPPATSFSRSPDEVRSMLSSYRTGLERGRRMAAGNDLSDRGDDARSGYGGPNPMAPRSDDDAAQ